MIWPAGYSARLTQNVEVLDGWDNVVLREGDAVTGTCDMRDGDPPQAFLTPPFK